MNPLFWILAKFIETDPYRKFARSWMANFTFRVWGWPTFKCSHYFKIKKAMEAYTSKKGMFVYTATDTKGLSFWINNKLTKCEWAHTGFLFFDGHFGVIAKSMTSHGLTVMPLLDYLSRVDNFAVGFIPMTENGEIEAKRRLTVVDVINTEGKVSYDFTVRLESSIADFIIRGTPLPNGDGAITLYCSEYVYLMCCGLVEGADLKPSWFYDRDVFEPDDVYHASTIIFDERNA